VYPEAPLVLLPNAGGAKLELAKQFRARHGNHVIVQKMQQRQALEPPCCINRYSLGRRQARWREVGSQRNRQLVLVL